MGSFGSFWVPLLLVRVPVFAEQWTLYRAEDGQPHLVSGYCPHRGTPLSLGVVVGSNLQCLHHGLLFQPSGKCIVDGYEITTIPVREKYGLIFAYFGSGSPPKLFFAQLEGSGNYWISPPEVWPCPFFLRLENTLDIRHVQSVHRYSNIADVIADPSYQITSHPGFIRLTLKAGPVVDYLAPNRLVFPVPIPQVGWRNIVCFRVPINNDTCISFSVALVNTPVPPVAPTKNPFLPSAIATIGERVLRGEVNLSDLVGRENLTEIEDYVVLVATHRSPIKTEKLAPFDEPIRLLRRDWLAASQNL